VATTISIDSVTTEDAAPTTAPHKISNQSGKNTVTVKFTPTTSDASLLRYWRVNFAGGGTRLTGTRLKSLGAVCGVSRCGAPGVKPLALPSGTQVTVAETYPQLPSSADGTYHVYVWAMNGTQGWNA
jgi:hypothetical protein